LCFDGWVRTAIKTGNPRPVQGTLSDQIETTSYEPCTFFRDQFPDGRIPLATFPTA
jgi:hypothetical protein